ncbi:hypothetical protein TSOC_011699 [Tetrabaena socialis]|uniref:Uncharacterized protein n=1 Tax=Tetrabaena socialis TaxID=47790 RepID=A0A2J7ZQ06_9CHLO|nr:hypothetical protein TSOC_011699 [Tetrabaena socialis]|eukprot:PNH02332.1 hypothetical protein TSOC_011699 [Tetrabaena socialis]
MARLSLLVEGRQAYYHAPEQAHTSYGGPYRSAGKYYGDPQGANLMQLEAWDGEPHEAYVQDAQAYVKRVADFEPLPLPRKRPTAAPGQDAPRVPTEGAAGSGPGGPSPAGRQGEQRYGPAAPPADGGPVPQRAEADEQAEAESYCVDEPRTEAPAAPSDPRLQVAAEALQLLSTTAPTTAAAAAPAAATMEALAAPEWQWGQGNRDGSDNGGELTDSDWGKDSSDEPEPEDELEGWQGPLVDDGSELEEGPPPSLVSSSSDDEADAESVATEDGMGEVPYPTPKGLTAATGPLEARALEALQALTMAAEGAADPGIPLDPMVYAGGGGTERTLDNHLVAARILGSRAQQERGAEGIKNGNVDGLSRLGHLIGGGDPARPPGSGGPGDDHADAKEPPLVEEGGYAELCHLQEGWADAQEVQILLSDGVTDAYRGAWIPPDPPRAREATGAAAPALVRAEDVASGREQAGGILDTLVGGQAWDAGPSALPRVLDPGTDMEEEEMLARRQPLRSRRAVQMSGTLHVALLEATEERRPPGEPSGGSAEAGPSAGGTLGGLGAPMVPARVPLGPLGVVPAAKPSSRADLDPWRDSALLEYLRTGKLPLDGTKSGEDNLREMTRLRKRARGYRLRGDKLFKRASAPHAGGDCGKGGC